MSLKPKDQRKHEPKFRDREDGSEPATDERFDALALASKPLAFLGPCSNPILGERLREALGQSR